MSWKTAVVIPILRPDKNSALAESYRPISLLPVLSKLAEKVILARLNDHLERENILIPEQHGFRPRLSTSHQLLRVVEFIKEGNNKDECTAAVFLDIQKAFDRLAANQNKLRFNRVASQQNFEKMKNEEKLKEDGFSCPSIFVFGSAHVASWLALPPSSVGVTVGALSPSGL
ncbi:putative RNA-directed DNA polymerase from transposon BS [Trichonephila clavipes]|nr:putative RNA-directed DNA polymerase from transposon BS [Trichonephila clavipes]